MARSISSLRLAAPLLVVVLAAACGAGAETSVPTSAPATLAPATALPAATATPATALEPPPATTAATEAATPAEANAAVPSGKTAEGYNYLGNPDAPITIQDFSDFY
jgi:hypothetical protein